MAYGEVGTHEHELYGEAVQATCSFKYLTFNYTSSFPKGRYVMEKWRDWGSRFYSSEKVFLTRAVSKQVGKEEFGIEKRGKYYMEK